eukprot:sb/3474366/
MTKNSPLGARCGVARMRGLQRIPSCRVKRGIGGRISFTPLPLFKYCEVDKQVLVRGLDTEKREWGLVEILRSEIGPVTLDILRIERCLDTAERERDVVPDILCHTIARGNGTAAHTVMSCIVGALRSCTCKNRAAPEI